MPKILQDNEAILSEYLIMATFFILLLYARLCPGICFYTQFSKTVKHNRCNLSMSLPLWLLLHTGGLGYSLFC